MVINVWIHVWGFDFVPLLFFVFAPLTGHFDGQWRIVCLDMWNCDSFSLVSSLQDNLAICGLLCFQMKVSSNSEILFPHSTFEAFYWFFFLISYIVFFIYNNSDWFCLDVVIFYVAYSLNSLKLLNVILVAFNELYTNLKIIFWLLFNFFLNKLRFTEKERFQ